MEDRIRGGKNILVADDDLEVRSYFETILKLNDYSVALADSREGALGILADANELKPAITEYNDYICAEILADKLELVPEMPSGTEIEVNDIPLKVLVTKKA